MTKTCIIFLNIMTKSLVKKCVLKSRTDWWKFEADPSRHKWVMRNIRKSIKQNGRHYHILINSSSKTKATMANNLTQLWGLSYIATEFWWTLWQKPAFFLNIMTKTIVKICVFKSQTNWWKFEADPSRHNRVTRKIRKSIKQNGRHHRILRNWFFKSWSKVSY